FGDEIDSIRRFDPQTQRSRNKEQRVTVYPAREGLWSMGDLAKAKPGIDKLLHAQAERLKKQGLDKEAHQLEEKLTELLERLSLGTAFPGADRFLPLIHAKLVNFLDYIPGAFVFLDEPARGEELIRHQGLEYAKMVSGFLERGVVLPEEGEILEDAEKLITNIHRRSSLHFSTLARPVKSGVPHRSLTLPFRPLAGFAGQSQKIIEHLKRYHLGGLVIGIYLHGAERREHLRKNLVDAGITVQMGPNPEGKDYRTGVVYILEGSLESGFEYPPTHTLLYTEAEIFGQARKIRKVRSASEGVKLSSFSDLKVGDYVVHVGHGIGRYLGMKTMEIAGARRDYLEVEYAGDDRLFIPADQVQLIQKYVGMDDDPPKIHRLGGGDWQRVKNRVKESIQEMAEGLLALYADRESVPGHAFAKDTVWQQEFEEAFTYDETPDQLRAVTEIKKDMESPQPMDRLLCGDVGYGKTEVAMRAAFKAVMDSKQVAVLVPTTILAQQHYQTFSQRFSGYPIRIEMISRFQTPRETEVILERLAKGEVDILIGTHRLFSKSVAFKSLGLLIVDEEQRFGVAHKERLKEISKNVDVLTLTATPIPRTLHMSLVGIRDMSVIETPPEDRFPVRTYVMEFNEEVIREALRREIDRGGQVYFVYNRVESIDRMAAYLQMLVPEATTLVAHGQMNEELLEGVMFDFYQGEADILVCTTIVESGLDVPNANTLIVYDADRFGLSQLYQLRGRVGRSNRVAHAYFTYRKDKAIGEVAEKRLAAIRDFTDLGSGFKIAMRDLEIRGAGNLLGPEQHGHIAAIGFELYCRLLEEAIRERKGDRKPETPEPTIELPVDALLPTDYVSDPRQRVEMYKKIAAAEDEEEIDGIEEEILDRYGDLPEVVRNLVGVAKIKILAKKAGVSSIGPERQELVARMFPGLTLDSEKVLPLLQKYKGTFRYQPGRIPNLRWKMTGMPWKQIVQNVIETLQNLA
ncbi:MAG TPA: transcription-repair coupling factor, partial [Bacillota bacterium]|nr:transcription-repair coupling factor [Bacillota bacterium]